MEGTLLPNFAAPAPPAPCQLSSAFSPVVSANKICRDSSSASSPRGTVWCHQTSDGDSLFPLPILLPFPAPFRAPQPPLCCPSPAVSSGRADAMRLFSSGIQRNFRNGTAEGSARLRGLSPSLSPRDADCGLLARMSHGGIGGGGGGTVELFPLDCTECGGTGGDSWRTSACSSWMFPRPYWAESSMFSRCGGSMEMARRISSLVLLTVRARSDMNSERILRASLLDFSAAISSSSRSTMLPSPFCNL
mmetsp:Transcript_104193/g.167917  ORF Transcript_104193/g.167917 Transcript_104193/m.167917 type:complete len:248 (-) Transcript_104193:1627-2370(-)